MAETTRRLPIVLIVTLSLACGQMPTPQLDRPDPRTPLPASAKPKRATYALPQYYKVEFGMREDDVKGILGEPTERTDAKTWRFVEVVENSARSIVVEFEDGRVFSKGANGFHAIDVDRLTKDNVAKVQRDMTEQEILDIFGPGNPTESIHGRALRYDDGTKSVLVEFAGGRVCKDPKAIGFD